MRSSRANELEYVAIELEALMSFVPQFISVTGQLEKAELLNENCGKLFENSWSSCMVRLQVKNSFTQWFE